MTFAVNENTYVRALTIEELEQTEGAWSKADECGASAAVGIATGMTAGLTFGPVGIIIGGLAGLAMGGAKGGCY